MTWHSIHVAYHDESLDDLVVDGVWPLFTALGPDVPARYLVRHWRRGPHLRLNLRTGGADLPAAVRSATWRIVGGYLADHPSTRVLDSGRFRELHRRLARLENDPGPTEPWYDNNTLRAAPYEPGLGGVWTDFHVATAELTFRMTDQVRRARGRLSLAYDLLIATAHRLSGRSLVEGFPSFRSHAEGFLTGFPEGPGMRARWDDHFARHADQLVDRARSVVAALDGGGPGVALVDEWTRVLAEVQQRARRDIEAGRLSLDDPEPGRYDPGLRPLPDVSAFHRTLMADDRSWADMRAATWFQAYRFALNCLYLQLTKLGVTPVERFMLCHLAADAVEAGYGVTALEVLRGRP
ncbi:hypothetical protein GCM10020358_58660 [Amorphoplanes nipponensis]|uniref:Thiopeptide-type bacteriocin biosynthesis domain-containing protein n=1 Tax=Actinoplanes nipponensis TaxID=135950 RepID=A0A919JCH9_9ACTN|nr:thiopeptide maturation pyridine synthase [Actinoplanes nipponensis]GIE46845.1 hypothetical protein Ani05nite_03790 [Actinoplanes nipponensis]